MVSCGALASVFGSFSLNAVFIFPVEPCLGWDGRPFIVQRKLIYTWKWKRASAVGCPGFFDGSALSLLGFRRAFRVVIHLHACGLCLLSPSPLLGPAFLLPLPPPSPVPYASREVYLLYLLAAATLGPSPRLRASWPVCAANPLSWRGFPGRDPVSLEVCLLPCSSCPACAQSGKPLEGLTQNKTC